MIKTRSADYLLMGRKRQGTEWGWQHTHRVFGGTHQVGKSPHPLTGRINPDREINPWTGRIKGKLIKKIPTRSRRSFR